MIDCSYFAEQTGSARLPAEGFVAVFDFSAAQAEDGEAFRETPARAFPPVAADGSAGDELATFIGNDFVHVGVALEHGDYTVGLDDF